MTPVSALGGYLKKSANVADRCGGGALAGGRWIAALLFGVTPADPLTFAAAVLTLGVIAACATYFPARRAARVDPAGVLRSDLL